MKPKNRKKRLLGRIKDYEATVARVSIAGGNPAAFKKPGSTKH